MGWTAKMRKERNPNAFNQNGTIKAGVNNRFSIQPPREPSENTITRLNAIQEIHDRVNNGEDLDEVCLEMAKRENIKKVYDMYVEHGSQPINILLKNAYLAKERNKEKVERINGLR